MNREKRRDFQKRRNVPNEQLFRVIVKTALRKYSIQTGKIQKKGMGYYSPCPSIFINLKWEATAEDMVGK
jgi:hypothetical protein